jgi:hypothetical protein
MQSSYGLQHWFQKHLHPLEQFQKIQFLPFGSNIKFWMQIQSHPGSSYLTSQYLVSFWQPLKCFIWLFLGPIEFWIRYLFMIHSMSEFSIFYDSWFDIDHRVCIEVCNSCDSTVHLGRLGERSMNLMSKYLQTLLRWIQMFKCVFRENSSSKSIQIWHSAFQSYRREKKIIDEYNKIEIQLEVHKLIEYNKFAKSSLCEIQNMKTETKKCKL